MRKFVSRLLVALGLALAGPALASQGSGCVPTSGTVSGVAFASAVNTALAALISSNSGASAPATDCSAVPIKGQFWLDTSTGTPAVRMYDGTTWPSFGALDLANHIWTPVVGGGVGAVASASTTDLCSVPQASLTITGTTTITGLGSTCVVGQIKLLSFSGALTLTNSGTLVLPGGADIVTVAGDRAVVSQVSSGVWAVFAYQRASGQPVVQQSGVYLGQINRLVITNGPTPAAQMVVTADAALIPTAAGGSVQRRTALSMTCSMAASGAAGLDAGSVAANTLYAVWIVDNGTAPQCMFSTSATSPTMPSGYTYLVRAGWVRTEAAAANLMRTHQAGTRMRFKVTPSTNTAALPAIATGAAGNVGTPTYVAKSLTGAVPSTAAAVSVVLVNQGNSAAVAPNGNYGAPTSVTNPPPCSFGNNPGYAAASVVCDLNLETTDVYYVASSSGSGVFLGGWDDSVNAN